MKDISFLHLGVIFVFIAAVVIAILVFTGALPGLRASRFRGLNSPIQFWGTLPRQTILPLIEDFQQKESNAVLIEYTQFSQEEYLLKVVSALAEGAGPDVWILPQQNFIEHSAKILIMGPQSYPERDFRERFFDGAGILLWPPGKVAAIPLFTDQLVLFWNRELFRNAGIAEAPKNWAGFLSSSIALTKKEGSVITQSGAAFGNFQNIAYAKDIAALFLLQAKNPIVTLSTFGSGENLRATLKSALNDPAFENTATTIASSIRFFDQFADPRKISYSWPRSMPDSLDAFAQGKLAMYIGYGSEIKAIKQKNPHLDFDIAEVPQLSPDASRITYGRLHALVLSKQGEPTRRDAGLLFMNYMSAPEAQIAIAETLNVAPTLRSLLAGSHENPFLATIYGSAVKNVFWHDPEPEASREILRNMTEDAAFEGKAMSQVINETHIRLQRLLDTAVLP